MVQKLTTEQFIFEANIKHNFKYNYCNSVYVKSNIKIKINCHKHGDFEQTPAAHLQGNGCRSCGIDSRLLADRHNNTIFRNNAIKVHGNKYDYSLVNYIKNNIKVKIICNSCNFEFQQTPSAHIKNKSGCVRCAIKTNTVNLTKTKDNFTKDAKLVHGEKYDYSLVNYINSNTKVSIICKKCNNNFTQLPSNHLSGKGCNRCCGLNSKPENDWIASLNIKDLIIQYKIPGTKYIVDAYSATQNTIYEFYGDYWHGNPKLYNSNKLNKKVNKTFGELYQMTLNKELCLKSAGYNIVYIWESDWKSIKNEAANI
jgi:hypothetical protein